MSTRGILSMFSALCLSMSLCISGCRSGEGEQAEANDSADPAANAPVYLENVQRMIFTSLLAPSGNVEAKNSVSVAARIPGTLDRIFVDEGDMVTAGKTDLFQTDSLKLGKALEASRKEYEVAEYSVRERQANLEQVQAEFNKVQLDYERYKRLYEQDKAITENAFEMKESHFLQTSAVLKHAHLSVELARKRMEQAQANLAIAEKELKDSLVQAPISGVVTERFLEPGEMAAAGTPVLRIEDLNVVEISTYLPEEAYDRVAPGKTRVHVHIGQIHLRNQVVSYKSPTVSTDLRTFEIRCIIRRPPDGLVPGRIAQMEVLLDSREGLGVPREAIAVRADGPVVFASDGARARMISVRTGYETNGWVEILEGDLTSDARVITAGKELLHDGVGITVIRKEQ